MVVWVAYLEQLLALLRALQAHRRFLELEQRRRRLIRLRVELLALNVQRQRFKDVYMDVRMGDVSLGRDQSRHTDSVPGLLLQNLEQHLAQVVVQVAGCGRRLLLQERLGLLEFALERQRGLIN